MWDTAAMIGDVIAFCISVNTSGCNTRLIYVELSVIYIRVRAAFGCWINPQLSLGGCVFFFTVKEKEEVICSGNNTAWGASGEEDNKKKGSLIKLTMNIKVYCAPWSDSNESIHMTQLLHGQVQKILPFKNSQSGLKPLLKNQVKWDIQS